jgi:hypothetical protein
LHNSGPGVDQKTEYFQFIVPDGAADTGDVPPEASLIDVDTVQTRLVEPERGDVQARRYC